MACPRAASVIARRVWLSGALAQQVAFLQDPLASEPRHAVGHPVPDLELRNPVFWKLEDWREELGLWGGGGHGGGGG